MSAKREGRDYLNDILESVDDIHEFTRGMTYAEFAADKKTVKAYPASSSIIFMFLRQL
jgi:uncharacterized protein with HEPN domain